MYILESGPIDGSTIIFLHGNGASGTDTEILDHVAERQCCSNIEDIQAHTGANTGKDCLTKNPTGK